MDIKQLFKISIEKNASDLHLTPGMSPALRLDGDLIYLTDFPVFNAEQTNKLIYSVMTPQQKEEYEEKLEIDFAMMVPNLGGFRVNVFHALNGTGAVFRVIPSTIPTIEQLGLSSLITQRNGYHDIAVFD